jgi:hypothetical protein
MSSVQELLALSNNYKSLNKNKQEEYKKLVNSKLEILTKHTDNTIKMCNSIMLDLATNVSNNFPNDPVLSTYAGVINMMANNKSTDLLSMFIVTIYQNDDYRKNILLENDKFFLTNNYQELKDQKDINIMFKFKEYWKDMNNELKGYLIKSLVTLVKVAEKYIECVGDTQDLKSKVVVLF